MGADARWVSMGGDFDELTGSGYSLLFVVPADKREALVERVLANVEEVNRELVNEGSQFFLDPAWNKGKGVKVAFVDEAKYRAAGGGQETGVLELVAFGFNPTRYGIAEAMLKGIGALSRRTLKSLVFAVGYHDALQKQKESENGEGPAPPQGRNSSFSIFSGR